MASLIILLIIIGFSAYLYLKSDFVRSFLIFVIIVLSSVPAFAFYEYVASFIFSSDNKKIIKLAPIAHPLCFFLLFVITAIVLLIVQNKLCKEKIILGIIAERTGRVICGFFSGLLLSGMLLVLLLMSPLPHKYPYERFSSTNPDVENPNKVLLNADGFVVGWFNIFSKGSLSGSRSFSVLHPDFLDTTFLNRLGLSKQVTIATTGSASVIEVPQEKGIWPAPEELTDDSGKPIRQKIDSIPTLVRVGLTKAVLQSGGAFTPLQLPLICKPKDEINNVYKGSAQVIYPIGYMKTPTQIEYKSLNSVIKPTQQDLDGTLKWVDFVYQVPADSVPVLLRFKSNTVLKLSKPVDASEAPEIIPFETSKTETDTEESLEEEM